MQFPIFAKIKNTNLFEWCFFMLVNFGLMNFSLCQSFRPNEAFDIGGEV